MHTCISPLEHVIASLGATDVVTIAVASVRGTCTAGTDGGGLAGGRRAARVGGGDSSGDGRSDEATEGSCVGGSETAEGSWVGGSERVCLCKIVVDVYLATKPSACTLSSDTNTTNIFPESAKTCYQDLLSGPCTPRTYSCHYASRHGA